MNCNGTNHPVCLNTSSCVCFVACLNAEDRNRVVHRYQTFLLSQLSFRQIAVIRRMASNYVDFLDFDLIDVVMYFHAKLSVIIK